MKIIGIKSGLDKLSLGDLRDRVQPVPKVDSDVLRNDLNPRENYVKEKSYKGDKIDIKA